MAIGLFIADKSAFEQQRHSSVADGLLKALAADGALFMTEMVALELLYSARSPSDYEERWEGLATLPWLHLTEGVARRALDIQRLLAAASAHRRPIPDLVIAATALEYGATVLHYDRDFDAIVGATDLLARWVIPRGTGHSG